jgi:hypothetical protein
MIFRERNSNGSVRAAGLHQKKYIYRFYSVPHLIFSLPPLFIFYYFGCKLKKKKRKYIY